MQCVTTASTCTTCDPGFTLLTGQTLGTCYPYISTIFSARIIGQPESFEKLPTQVLLIPTISISQPNLDCLSSMINLNAVVLQRVNSSINHLNSFKISTEANGLLLSIDYLLSVQNLTEMIIDISTNTNQELLCGDGAVVKIPQ